jgi:signal transduction histidine kinase
MNVELVITNVGLLISLVVSVSLGLLVYIKRPKEHAEQNIMYAVLVGLALVWVISYDLGINVHDPQISRAFLAAAILSALFIIIANIHLLLVVIGKLHDQRKFLAFLYSLAGIFTVFYALFPDTLLLPSEPQLYLPNFFNKGPLFGVQDTFFFLCFVYFIFQMIVAYKKADFVMRNRLKFFLVGNMTIYGLGLFPEFLLYGIPVDPLPAAFSGLYNIPMAYAILKYNLIDINLLAKRALGYAASVAAVTFFILFIGYANDLVEFFLPSFPVWLLPFLSAILAVTLSVMVWKKVKEVDILKYQFVDVVTHKFRTPLTHIKWSAENLRDSKDRVEKEHALEDITHAYKSLFQLTDMLAAVSAAEGSEFEYKFEPVSVRALIEDIIRSEDERLRERGVTISSEIKKDLPDIFVDKKKIEFAIETVIENSLIYSPANSKIEVNAEVKKKDIILWVRDYGMGISQEDLPRLFSKFYRSRDALKAHTEGMGIGLYLSRDILQRHGGDLWAASGGAGQGSTFYFRIPIAEK